MLVKKFSIVSGIRAAFGRKQGQSGQYFLLNLQKLPITIFLNIKSKNEVADIPARFILPAIEPPTLNYEQRIECWKKYLVEYGSNLNETIKECSRRFRFEKETIKKICGSLTKKKDKASRETLIAVCKIEVETNIGELAQKITPRFLDEKLILPTEQHNQFLEITKAMKSLTRVHYEIGTAKAWNESGISVLFAGPPGTGKTMGAEILALELDLPIYKIDLSQVVNKYIGETEKNLKQIFDAADISDLILFFDEADALFGKRTEVNDAHDRYANLEISYLLERMERSKGLTILATNRKKDLDEAFLRRLRYVIDFSSPGINEREKIWKQVIPSTIDVSEIDFRFLAKQFQLSGGNIRSIVFNTCLQSINGSAENHKPKITMLNILTSLKREYDKIKRTITVEQLGNYAEKMEEISNVKIAD